MIVTFVQVPEGARRFMMVATEAEAREELKEFLTG